MEFCFKWRRARFDCKHLVPIALLKNLNANETVFNLRCRSYIPAPERAGIGIRC